MSKHCTGSALNQLALSASTEQGPFASHALEYSRAGIVAIPCKGKVPAIKNWTRWKWPPSFQAINKFGQQFPGANIGAATEQSHLTVIDLDRADLLPGALEEFGDTPAIARTSKGHHAYYRFDGERTQTGFHPGIDVRAAGGFVVLPPSIHPVTGNEYQWIDGSPEVLKALPKVRPGSVPKGGNGNAGIIPQGRRNDLLFKHALKDAKVAESYGHLRLMVTARAEQCDPPISNRELDTLIASAWRYQQTGTNWAGSEAKAVTSRSVLTALIDEPYAHALLCRLQMEHSARCEPWCFVVKAIWKAKLFPGWGRDTIDRALKTLLERGFVELAHRREGCGNPHKYRLRVSPEIQDQYNGQGYGFFGEDME